MFISCAGWPLSRPRLRAPLRSDCVTTSRYALSSEQPQFKRVVGRSLLGLPFEIEGDRRSSAPSNQLSAAYLYHMLYQLNSWHSIFSGRPLDRNLKVALDLGISSQTIFNWRRQDRIDKGFERGSLDGEHAELFAPAADRPARNRTQDRTSMEPLEGCEALVSASPATSKAGAGVLLRLFIRGCSEASTP